MMMQRICRLTVLKTYEGMAVEVDQNMTLTVLSYSGTDKGTNLDSLQYEEVTRRCIVFAYPIGSQL
jgi:hypothetical protein